ncbi:histone-lysine N-methyltransferase eggless isoform X1 [Pararge aegeria]|uniref:histone-lysine N-methyltransferase eggless isoform X1 n=1 Tax=Pararge aegeria TaxID=116150 RepID=UPI0019D2B028|nr:histone-lysine N-methyltransferase eggless isoform X1 [Pararge aegeria]
MKISDASDAEGTERKNERSVEKALSSLLDEEPGSSDFDFKTWTRKKRLSITNQERLNFVDLGESSSDEDKKQTTSATKQSRADLTTEDTSSDVPHAMTEITKSPVLVKDEVKPDEAVTVKTKSPTKAEAPTSHSSETKARSPIGLEVFNLDSDEEDSNMKPITEIEAVKEAPEKLRKLLKCINRSCTNNDPNIAFYIPDRRTVHYFDADKKKHAYVCEKCADIVEKRNQDLIDGIRNFTPLFQLHTTRISEELVEISDSDSDEEVESGPVQLQLVGAEGAEMLTEKLADMINETWEKFQMDTRIEESRKELLEEMDRLQKESKDLDTIFNECQTATDKLRNSLYATFDPLIQEQPAIVIFDTPNCSNTGMEHTIGRRLNKRRLSPSRETSETPTKKSVSSLTASVASESSIGYSEHKRTLEQDASTAPFVEKCDDDNMDISVVQLSVEVAPADLPPPGDLSHPPIRLGMTVYAMKNAFGTWLRAKVVEIQPKAHNIPFTMVRVRFEHKVSKNPFKTLPARCLAYFEPSEVRMTIGTRVIALFKDISLRQAYYSGIVAEIPNPVNNYRYLIFFDDGYAQYATHSQTRLVCEFSSLVWEEVHPYSREFVRSYLLAYPERPMVRLHAGQNLKTEWRGKWWSSRVINVDASLVEVQFLRCDRREWIYRGSTRLAPLYLELQAAERHRPRALPRTQPQVRVNMPYVEYTRSDEQANKQPQTQRQQQNEEIRRQRAVAKKSTAIAPQPPVAANNDDATDSTTSRVVYYTPKNAVKPLKMTPHTCSPKCKRTDVLALKELRTYNPLAKPLLSGWERQVVRGRGLKQVMYVAPCGRRLRNVRELHRYLRSTDCDMPVDLFDFSPTTHCLAEYVLNKCFVGKKDLSHGKEIVPVPCVNCVDDSLPEFCSYNTERTPTAGVPLNLDPEFLCGCDCEDDCEDKAKCACWKMTLEGARTIGYEGDVGYDYRRLPEPLPSGIYECNSRCKCKNTCLNRVAQHPLQLKLQVFKTDKRGWGIRALNDVPKGAFLCVYAGNLLTDATANLDGLNEGDEYLAELDYIEVVEQMKEGFEEDIPDKIKAKDKKELARKKAEEEDEEDEESSEEENTTKRSEQEDDDFVPGIPGLGLGVAAFSKRLRRRDSRKEEDTKPPVKEKEADEDCITISDDEEVREPSCFTAAAGMGNNQFISKYRSVRTLFGEDEACYIMDAKVQGNIGRYLNHSCTPNVFVQNVFVDTHDPRFPWVAFFALHHIRAGTELTWNYNYDVGSVPGKVLYCFCGAPNCRGRLL